MLFLLLLVAGYALVRLVPARGRWDERDRWRLALGAAIIFAGVSHLVMPTPFVQHLPSWVPARETLVFATGLVEIAFGPALWFTKGRARRWTGWALAVYLVGVFPGNIYVAVAGIDVQGQPDGLYAWLRLPLQVLFVWLALWCTGAVGNRTVDAQPLRVRTRAEAEVPAKR